jgi:steroid delta-isomerase-like uncharacterized protein
MAKGEPVGPGADVQGEPIEGDALRAFTRRYFEAWNSHMPSAVAACTTDDVVWDSPALPDLARGPAAVAGLVTTTVTAFPDYEFTQPAPWAIAEDRLTAYVPWRMTGTHTGSFDPPGYAATGRTVDLRGIDVWRLRNGLIWRYQAVYNFSLVPRQLGLTPPRGGRLERVAVHAQRLFVRLRPQRPLTPVEPGQERGWFE